MFKEFEEFKEAEAKINARIEQFTAEVEQKKQEHAKAATTYKKMMVDDSAGIKSYNTSELNKAKMRADELASELEVAQERLQMVSVGKPEKLKALLNDVKQGWERENQQLNIELQGIFKAAREHRAKLTLEIRKGHERYLKARELLQELNRAEQTAGLHSNQITRRLGVPEMPLLKEYRDGYSVITDKCVIPSDGELEAAYQKGEVPLWISHYAATGEVVTNDDLRPKEKKTGESKEKSTGLLGKLFGRGGQQKVLTYQVSSSNPKRALEDWKHHNPSANIISTTQLDGSIEIQYTLPVDAGK